MELRGKQFTVYLNFDQKNGGGANREEAGPTLHNYTLTLWLITLTSHLWPVVWATLIRPLWNMFFRRAFRWKFLAPPVTEIRRLGGERFHCSVNNWYRISGLVSVDTRTYWEWTHTNTYVKGEDKDMQTDIYMHSSNVIIMERNGGFTLPIFCPKPPKQISPKASVHTSRTCLCLSHDSPVKSSGLMASSTWLLFE